MNSINEPPLLPLIDKLLIEPKPVRRLRDTPLMAEAPTAVEKSLEGLYLAIDTVANGDFIQREKDWYQRRDFLLECRTALTQSDPSDSVADTAAAEKSQRMFSKIQTESRLAQQRALESTRKHKAFAKSLQRATNIYAQYERAINNISRTAEQQVGRVGLDNQAAVDQIIAEAAYNAEAASNSAAQRINNQTRYVLNLDENTAPISIIDWLDRHNLSL
ncbi:Uncharacterised protein [Mycobacteroides abscessus subsp. bolletii]|nr:Uncharacterised protein [Mycobacteroides abscessus subsp. bolletii]SKX37847.1 Uncharacterised protein [Mycobacteroides abscessus subsp. bolletii]